MIFPKIYPPDKNSPAEKMVFAALEKLSEQDFDVFFSKSFRGIKDRQQDDYEIDFIIVDKRGSHINSIIIVEVKGGRLSYSGSENRWSQNGHLMDEGPDEQARKNKHFFLNKFHDAVTQIPVDWVVWFPEVQLQENCEMPTILERWQLFDNLSLAYPELQLQEASDSIIKNHANLSGISIPEYESTIKSGLLRGIGFVQPLNILIKQYDEIYHNLAKEQTDFLSLLLLYQSLPFPVVQAQAKPCLQQVPLLIGEKWVKASSCYALIVCFKMIFKTQ